MKFFKPEVVSLWNHSNPLGSDKTKEDVEWDASQDAYEAHFTQIADELPRSVRYFTECVLFNELVISLPKPSGYLRGENYTVVTANNTDKQMHILTYVLEQPPAITVHEGPGFDPPASDGVWLYDEFSVTEDGLFRHNVLFSNGSELEIRFKSLHWHQAAIELQG